MNDASDDTIGRLRKSEIKRLSELKEWPDNYDNADRGVLLSDKIRHYCEDFGLIDPFDQASLRPAGYDLRVGSNYSIRGERYALNDAMSLEIGPYQVAIIETYETLNLPKFLIGRWNIRVQHAYKGLLWVGGAQVDPGFRGRLCCPIYNLSTEPVRLEFKERLAMIDFVTTTHFESGCELFPWPTRKMLVFREYPKLSSGIENEVREFREEITSNQENAVKQITEIKREIADTKAETKERIDTNVANIQGRIDSYTARTLTVLAVLFAALGLAVSRVPEISYLSSATPLAAVALWFALRSYYVSATQQTGPARRVPWFEMTIGLILGVILLGIQYKISQKYQNDFAATRDAVISAQRDVRDIRQDQANQKEVQRRIDSLQQQIDALKSQKH
jgi:dCTP deaminase